MNETSKSAPARERHRDARYLTGRGLDIGCGPDPLPGAQKWDVQDGDAEYLATIPSESFDYVYSSHCLEHMRNVPRALSNWSRVVKAGGYLFIVVPEWTLYEHRQWPSPHNPDHKATFAVISSELPTRENHFTAADMIHLGGVNGMRLLEVRIEMDGFNWSAHTTVPPFNDQTMGAALAQAVFIFGKLPSENPIRR